jgi:hypothetical protein
LAISLSNLATSEAYEYKNYYDFICDEPTRDTSNKFCIFHDINFLKDDNYEKHKAQEYLEIYQKRMDQRINVYGKQISKTGNGKLRLKIFEIRPEDQYKKW